MNLENLPEQIKLKGYASSRSVFLNDQMLRPKESQLMYNHSPDGFNWGYGGSGPAQLALAILLRILTVDEAMKLHQAFKFKVIGKLPQNKNFNVVINFRNTIKEIINDGQ
jgi:hypothetical protein